MVLSLQNLMGSVQASIQQIRIMAEAISMDEQEGDSFKKINQQLVRKIHARNKKIKFLFGCIQEFEKIYVDQENLLNELTGNLVRDMGQSEEHNNSSIVSGEVKVVPAPRKVSLNKSKREENIFKRQHSSHNSISAIKARVFEEDKMIRLPMISSFKVANAENPQRMVHQEARTEPKKQKSTVFIDSEKKKVYRVPAQKLVPLSLDEIKQRIEKRFR